MKNTMLSNLVSYSDSEDDDDEETHDDQKQQNVLKFRTRLQETNEIGHDNNLKAAKKRRTSDVNNETTHKKVKKKSSLPLPSSIGSMFGGVNNEHESVTKHQGRKRAFEHVEGNWASYVFIPLIETSNILLLCEKVVKFLNHDDRIKVKLHPFQPKDCHLTLSRTVAVRHYWMDSIYAMLKEKFEGQSKFFYSISGLEVYTNDDKSRTFISLKIDTIDSLLKAVDKVDQVFKEFNLAVYYKEPSFHISIAWFLGDHKKMIDQIIHDNEKSLFLGFGGDLEINMAEKVCVKFGHKLQQINLV